VSGFNFTAAKLSLGGDLGEQHLGKSAAQLAALCNDAPACKGFTSTGWLKSSIKLPALWANWSGAERAGPCDGMFVKTGAEFEGGWLPASEARPYGWQLGGCLLAVRY